MSFKFPIGMRLRSIKNPDSKWLIINQSGDAHYLIKKVDANGKILRGEGKGTPFSKQSIEEGCVPDLDAIDVLLEATNEI